MTVEANLYNQAVQQTVRKYQEKLDEAHSVDENIQNIRRFCPKVQFVVLDIQRDKLLERASNLDKWLVWLGVKNMTEVDNARRSTH